MCLVLFLGTEREDYSSSGEREKEKERAAHNKLLSFIAALCFPGREDDPETKLQKQKNPLPHWLTYLAYFICIGLSVVCGFFVILYGFQFGSSKADQWMLSMILSFLESVFIIQPVKVCCKVYTQSGKCYSLDSLVINTV